MTEATRREANELYTFFSLLASGSIGRANALGKTDSEIPVFAVRRHEHDGQRLYAIEEKEVHIQGTAMDVRFPREDFAAAAEWLLSHLKQQGSETIDITELEGFLDALAIYDMEAQTDDRTDLHLTLWHPDAPPIGMRLHSRLCSNPPLFVGGRGANIKYEQSGVRFSQPAVSKINHTDQPENVAEVARRILYIQSQGGILRYCDVADKVFRSNLLMLDTNLPRIIAAMLMTLHLDGTSRLTELVKMLDEKNPLKMKEELLQKHGFYQYKVRQLLLATAWGLRPQVIWNGRASAVGGYLMTDENGTLAAFLRADEQTFSDYLLAHARLVKTLPDEDKYGYLERENGNYYLKLNLKINMT